MESAAESTCSSSPGPASPHSSPESHFTSVALRNSLRRDICGETVRIWAAVLDDRGMLLGMQRVGLSSTGAVVYREPAYFPCGPPPAYFPCGPPPPAYYPCGPPPPL
jgi:hypothetical protein